MVGQTFFYVNMQSCSQRLRYKGNVDPGNEIGRHAIPARWDEKITAHAFVYPKY